MVAPAKTDRTGSTDNRAAVDKAICLLMSFETRTWCGRSRSLRTRAPRRSELKSTATRVLAMLERNGVVERVGKTTRLGLRLHELGRSVYAPTRTGCTGTLIPYLSDLYEATHETIHLASLHGTDVVYLAKLYGHRRSALPPGSVAGARVRDRRRQDAARPRPRESRADHRLRSGRLHRVHRAHSRRPPTPAR